MNIDMESNDLIYNRFDIIFYNKDCSLNRFRFSYKECVYEIECAFIEKKVFLNIWGKDIPEVVLDNILHFAEREDKQTKALFIQRTLKNYRDLLVRGEESVLCLPDNEEELLQFLTTKERSHLRQYKKHLEKDGKLEIKVYESDIPARLVTTFFLWKKGTHNHSYGISENEYLEKYHVTNALEVLISDNNCRKSIAVLFWCQVNKTVYLENLSYDLDYRKYSPGYLAYIEFLKELIKRKCKVVFLGGAKYGYKMKFNSTIRECYSGYIFTSSGYAAIDLFFESNGYKKWGIWGCGNLGKSVLECNKYINFKMSFAIDRDNSKCLSGIRLFTPYQEWPETDIIIITIKGKDEEIEAELMKRARKYLYYDEWVEIILKEPKDK